MFASAHCLRPTNIVPYFPVPIYIILWLTALSTIVSRLPTLSIRHWTRMADLHHQCRKPGDQTVSFTVMYGSTFSIDVEDISYDFTCNWEYNVKQGRLYARRTFLSAIETFPTAPAIKTSVLHSMIMCKYLRSIKLESLQKLLFQAR